MINVPNQSLPHNSIYSPLPLQVWLGGGILASWAGGVLLRLHLQEFVHLYIFWSIWHYLTLTSPFLWGSNVATQ